LFKLQDLLNNMRPIIFIFLILSLRSLNGQHKSLSSVTGTTVSQAKKQCESEGKLLLIYFHADWVQPCQWMKTRTFHNQEILSFLNENVIFLELNLDSQSGITEKENFKVNVLPTIILFDALGNQLIRLEEVMDAKKLLAVLKNWNVPENRSSKTGNLTDHSPELSIQHLDKPKLIIEAGNPIPKYEGSTYGIIIRYFYQYEEALSYSREFQRKVEKPVSFHEIGLSDGLKQYQIIVSKFSNQEEARAYLPKLRMLGISGEIIKF